MLGRGLAKAFPDAHLKVTGASLMEFLKTLEEPECDVMVADYALGWGDGFDFIREARARWPECGAILFTVMPSEQLFSRAISAGFDACLAKSADLMPLALAVQGALARKGKLR